MDDNDTLDNTIDNSPLDDFKPAPTPKIDVEAPPPPEIDQGRGFYDRRYKSPWPWIIFSLCILLFAGTMVGILMPHLPSDLISLAIDYFAR